MRIFLTFTLLLLILASCTRETREFVSRVPQGPRIPQEIGEWDPLERIPDEHRPAGVPQFPDRPTQTPPSDFTQGITEHYVHDHSASALPERSDRPLIEYSNTLQRLMEIFPTNITYRLDQRTIAFAMQYNVFGNGLHHTHNDLTLLKSFDILVTNDGQYLFVTDVYETHLRFAAVDWNGILTYQNFMSLDRAESILSHIITRQS